MQFVGNLKSMKTLLLKVKLVKSLSEIFNDILKNNFELENLDKTLPPTHRIPLSEYLEQLNFKYDFNSSNLERKSNLINYLIFLFHLINVIRNMIYVFFDSFDDNLFRLYCGEMFQFLLDKISFAAVALTGITSYGLSTFCLFNYWPMDQLQWLNVLNAVEGKQSFLSIKIHSVKSAKKLIRFSLIMLTSCSVLHYVVFLAGSIFIPFAYIKLDIKNFIFFALPWGLFNMLWDFYTSGYVVASFYVVIICYYYQLRLDQLEFYGNLLLKRKQVNRSIMKLLNEYNLIIQEINQFNKFASKLIFCLYTFMTSTVMFLIYNILYVKLNVFVFLVHILVAFLMSLFTLLIVFNATRIPLQLKTNLRNLISLNYHKNLPVKTRIKVSFIIKYSYIYSNYFIIIISKLLSLIETIQADKIGLTCLNIAYINRYSYFQVRKLTFNY